jgi:hypothetical protein
LNALITDSVKVDVTKHPQPQIKGETNVCSNEYWAEYTTGNDKRRFNWYIEKKYAGNFIRPMDKYDKSPLAN